MKLRLTVYTFWEFPSNDTIINFVLQPDHLSNIKWYVDVHRSMLAGQCGMWNDNRNMNRKGNIKHYILWNTKNRNKLFQLKSWMFSLCVRAHTCVYITSTTNKCISNKKYKHSSKKRKVSVIWILKSNILSNFVLVGN